MCVGKYVHIIYGVCMQERKIHLQQGCLLPGGVVVWQNQLPPLPLTRVRSKVKLSVGGVGAIDDGDVCETVMSGDEDTS